MSNQLTARDAAPHTTPDTAPRAIGLLSLVGGAAWVIDTVTIAVLNRAFDPLDSVLFFVGLACFLGTLLALAVHLSTGRTGPARGALGLGIFLTAAAALGAISFAADRLARRIFSPENIGLHDEWSCFTIGLCLLAISGWALRQGQRRGQVGARRQ